MSAELVIAVVGLVDICLKYSKEIQKVYRAVKEADEDLEELVIRFELACTRCAEQVNFLQRKRHLFERSHLELQHRALEILVRKLERTEALLSNLVTPKAFKGSITLAPKRLQYGLHKDTLVKAVGAVEAWQKLSDPQWFVTNRLSACQFDVGASTQAVAGYPYGSTPSIPSLLQHVEPITNMEMAGMREFYGHYGLFDSAWCMMILIESGLLYARHHFESGQGCGSNMIAVRYLLKRHEEACAASSRIIITISRLLLSGAITTENFVQFELPLSREQKALSGLMSEWKDVWTEQFRGKD